MHSRVSGLVIALAVAGCTRPYDVVQADASTPRDARITDTSIADSSAKDAPADAPPATTANGLVGYIQTPANLAFVGLFGVFDPAAVMSRSLVGCTAQRLGDCVRNDCPGSVMFPTPVASAGEIALSRGGAVLHSVTPSAAYLYTPPSVGRVLTFGDALLVNALGAEVPAWNQIINWVPPPDGVMVAALSSTGDSVVEWPTGQLGAADRVGVEFGEGAAFVQCEAAGSSGSLTIPAAAHAGFSSTVYVTPRALSVTHIVAGTYDVAIWFEDQGAAIATPRQ
jgi:hypothetical protein